MPHPYFDLPRPTILGHRGAAGLAPENTLLAFARGLADGAQIVESDVHVTRDGVPVLIHDPHVDRTTEGRGPLDALDLAAVQRLDAGYRFSSEDGATFPFRGQGLRIPTLREAFETHPDARFNLEIKAPGRALIRQIVEMVVELDREERTLLVAGEDAIQRDLRAVLAESAARPALGASLSDILDVVRAATAGRAPTTDSMALQIPAEFGGNPLVTRPLVDHCHAHGLVVHVWTINDPTEMRRLLDLGVDGIVTDRPDRMAALIAADRG